MKAWVLKSVGATPIYTEAPEPTPGREASVIKVEAAALNFSDLLMIRGQYQIRPQPPFTPGQEVAGTVVTVGPGSRFRIGQRLASKTEWGAFAEYVELSDQMAIAIPDEVPLQVAVALPVVYTTAHIALCDRAQLKARETLLVHAAAGGIGLAAVQIGKALGAKVLATAGGKEKCNLVASQGADVVFDHQADDWFEGVKECTAGKGADVIVDPVGGDTTDQSLKCIAARGRLLIIGFSSGTIPRIRANRLLLKNASAVGVYWSHEQDLELVQRTIDELLRLLGEGSIKPVIGNRFPLQELPAALEVLQNRQAMGKILLTC